MFTADGTHLVRTFSSGTTPATATTQVTVVDVATATQLGQTITLSGYYQVQGFNTNDTRAVLKGTFAYPDDTVGIAVINVESGAQVGETMLLTRPTGDQNNTSTVSLSADRNLSLSCRHNLRPQFVRGGGDDHRRVDRHHPARDRPVRVRHHVYGHEWGTALWSPPSPTTPQRASLRHSSTSSTRSTAPAMTSPSPVCGAP